MMWNNSDKISTWSILEFLVLWVKRLIGGKFANGCASVPRLGASTSHYNTIIWSFQASRNLKTIFSSFLYRI